MNTTNEKVQFPVIRQTVEAPLETVASPLPRWKTYVNSVIAAELSRTTRYFDQVIQVAPLPNDYGSILSLMDAPSKSVCGAVEHAPDLRLERERRSVFFMNGNLNYQLDIQAMLARLRGKMSRTSRIVAVAYNPYLEWLYKLANLFGLRKGAAPCTFLTRTSLTDLARISGFEIARIRPVAVFPFRLFGIGSLINYVVPMIPWMRWFCVSSLVILRPVGSPVPTRLPSLSVVIPARNEKGNIENALKQMPDFGAPLEIIFVEGHSKDGTWEEIQRVCREYGSRFRLSCYRQTGKGKGDAVRLGFQKATGDLLTILDADLTMPPEKLTRFYQAYVDGHADFINGSRLVYPMEGEAMRFLNRLGNIFFVKALSAVLDVRVSDTLCGTKLMARHDYARMVQWREDFGDFDPFGDFELIFPAAMLGLGIVDVPVHYRDRTYGQTNIHRFRHGLMLLRMTVVGLLRIRAGGWV